MAEIYCGCKSCEIERNNLQKQLDHPFYKKVDDFRDEIKAETMAKAAKKYKEPFNPTSWSVKELGKHAMAENYDQGNYIVGLMDAAEGLEKELEKYKSRCKDYEVKINKHNQELEFARQEAEFWRLKAIKGNGQGTIFDEIKKALGENLDAKG